MEWVVINWWWISWILSLLVIPGGLGVLKVIATKTETVKDDRIVTLLIEWWNMSRGLLKR